MKFAVGYQLPGDDDEPIVDVIAEYVEHMAEVYFPWADLPPGRASRWPFRACAPPARGPSAACPQPGPAGQSPGRQVP